MTKAFAFPRQKLCLALCTAAFLIPCISVSPSDADPANKRVLVVSVTKGFRHGSIPVGEQVLKELGEKSGAWEVEFARTDEDVQKTMTAESLKTYDAVFFNNTTGDLPIPDREAFLAWIKAGGGFAGAHAATDTYHNWPEFIEMIGGQFASHGAQVEVECLVEDPKHPATAGLPASFKIHEEMYLFKNFSRNRVRGLITLDKHPNTGEPGDYPISWVRLYGRGRVFYTSLGHREDVWQNELVQRHLIGGMRWLLRLANGSALPRLSVRILTSEEKRAGFKPLSNGRNLSGWHVRHEGRAPWRVENGMLVMGHGGTDIITDQRFRDFEIRYEYMIPKGGNSGVYLRGRYEIQVLDDYDEKKPTSHGNGAVYGKIAPSRFASRAPGEWQTVEARLIGNRVTVVLNGVKVIDHQPIDGPTGGALDGNVDEPGPIMLQGDHAPVAYRKIRIKPLD